VEGETLKNTKRFEGGCFCQEFHSQAVKEMDLCLEVNCRILMLLFYALSYWGKL
jgi:hypothetical protein